MFWSHFRTCQFSSPCWLAWSCRGRTSPQRMHQVDPPTPALCCTHLDPHHHGYHRILPQYYAGSRKAVVMVVITFVRLKHLAVYVSRIICPLLWHFVIMLSTVGLFRMLCTKQTKGIPVKMIWSSRSVAFIAPLHQMFMAGLCKRSELFISSLHHCPWQVFNQYLSLPYTSHYQKPVPFVMFDQKTVPVIYLLQLLNANPNDVGVFLFFSSTIRHPVKFDVE